MTDTHGLNLTTHRAAESVWERSGWDGTREQLALTRWLVGIGGGALALQAFVNDRFAGSLLAGVGGEPGVVGADRRRRSLGRAPLGRPARSSASA